MSFAESVLEDAALAWLEAQRHYRVLRFDNRDTHSDINLNAVIAAIHAALMA
jgi:hypothetical protein